MNRMFERYFQLAANGTTVRTEVIAGVTTFLTMAYIIFVNPDILAVSGMPKETVFVATCLVAALGSAVMGLYANYPIAIAPGMSVNTYFAFVVVKSMGFTWQAALGAALMSGILFMLVSFFKLRDAIIDVIPRSMRFGISAGVGLFLAIIGLQHAGLIVSNSETLLNLGDLHNPSAIFAIIGFILMVVLDYWKVPGAIIIGIFTVTALAFMFGLAPFLGFVAMPPPVEPIFMQIDVSGVFNGGMLGIILSFFIVELFDASGALLGIGHYANFLDANGKMPRLREALLTDSGAVLVGSLLGTSPTAVYIESAAGTTAGGRTGLTALVVGILFLCALFFAPLAGSIPAYATAPAFCYVAMRMLRGFAHVQWDDLTEAVPAAVTAVSMPFTFSIATGIAFGFIAYVTIKILSLQEIKPIAALIVVLFMLKYIFL